MLAQFAKVKTAVDTLEKEFPKIWHPAMEVMKYGQGFLATAISGKKQHPSAVAFFNLLIMAAHAAPIATQHARNHGGTGAEAFASYFAVNGATQLSTMVCLCCFVVPFLLCVFSCLSMVSLFLGHSIQDGEDAQDHRSAPWSSPVRFPQGRSRWRQKPPSVRRVLPRHLQLL